MHKKKYFHDTHEINITVKGFTSILVGVYLFCGTYLIKSILSGFLIEDNVVGMFSAEIIEFLVVAILFLVFLFSSLALIFSGRRVAKRHQFQLWNSQTKKTAFIYFLFHLFQFILLLLLMNKGFVDEIAPAFLISYGLLLFLFKNKERKQLLVLSGLALCLAILCSFIPGYWASAISILAIAHMAYGVVIR